jgi:hypothetical protein
MKIGAIFSPDGLYRYWLRRDLEPQRGKRILFIMLNPSTADGEVDDPTIRRCKAFAEREGGSVLEVVNLYALRTPHPVVLRGHPAPVGPANDQHLRSALRGNDLVVCAWGADEGPIRGRSAVVAALALDEGQALWCLGTTQSGAPRHPLYVRGDQPLIPWRGLLP